MSVLVGAELLKLRTTRGWIGYLLALVVLSGIGAAGGLGAAEKGRLDTTGFQRDLLASSHASGLIALLVGITAVTAEWRHGTITRTFLVTPRRELVVAAKGMALIAVGAVLAVVSVAVVLAVAVPWLAIDGASIHVGGLGGIVARIVVGAALWGLLGVAVGSAVQSQTGALVGAILWVVLVEPLFAVLLGLAGLERVGDFLPARSLQELESTGGSGLTPGAAFAVGLAWIAVVGALGCVRVIRRDIT